MLEADVYPIGNSSTPASTPQTQNFGHFMNDPGTEALPDSFAGQISPTLPHILILHCGGTFGMKVVPEQNHDEELNECKPVSVKVGADGMLASIELAVPEVLRIATVHVQIVMNVDSNEIGPDEWIHLAKTLHNNRDTFHGFVIIHGTDTMVYTGAAISLLLQGFGKAIVLTGAQIPLVQPRSDARQNLLDAVTVATSGKLFEVGICFGGALFRANRAIKMASSSYGAFDSPNFPRLAEMGSTVEWNDAVLLGAPGPYVPRFKLDANVVRISVVPGLCPYIAFGDISERGVRGIVVEAFGLGNLPSDAGGRTKWVSWLTHMKDKGVLVYIGSQCLKGPLNPNLYKNGAGIINDTFATTKRMTAETAVVKLMLCLTNPELSVHVPIAGEL